MRVLSEQIVHQHGAFRRVRQYLAGHHPHLGRLHHGWSGPETIVEKCLVLPHYAVRVVEADEREGMAAAAD